MKPSFLRLVVLACSLVVLAEGSQAQFLYRHGERIPLKLSKKFLAVRLNPGISPNLAMFTSAIANGSAKEMISNSPILQSEGVVLVVTAGPSEPNAALPHFTSSANEFGTVLPVYEMGETELVLTNTVLVKLKPPGDRELIQNLRSVGDLTPSVNGGYLLTLLPGKSALAVSNDLAQDKRIEYAEPNFIELVRPRPHIPARSPRPRPASPSKIFPSDVYFSQQWSLENNGETGKKGSDIRVRQAWNTATGSGITIAIIDDGVDVNHPDLASKVVKPFDALTGGSDPKPSAWWDLHGTSCAGVAGATTNNIQGMAGAGYKASIMPIKVASTAVDGGAWITKPEIIAKGINWAIENGADVINISWTSDDQNPVIETAILDGMKKGRHGLGTVFVFAAGNEGTAVDWPAKMAGDSSGIAVSALNEWDELKSDKSQDGEPGWASNFGKEITVAAPGIHIFTTNVTGDAGAIKGNYYSGFNGTSSAAPHVAGVAALVLSKEPTLTAVAVKKRLQDSADLLNPTVYFGAGRVDACKAVMGTDCH